MQEFLSEYEIIVCLNDILIQSSSCARVRLLSLE